MMIKKRQYDGVDVQFVNFIQQEMVVVASASCSTDTVYYYRDGTDNDVNHGNSLEAGRCMYGFDIGTGSE